MACRKLALTDYNMQHKTILVLAPHNDDETLGCGATIAKHISLGNDVFVATLTSIDDANPVMKPNKEMIRQETKSAIQVLGVPEENIIFEDLPNVLVPDIPVHEVNKIVYSVIEKVCPDVLYLPFMYDLHKDHRDILYAAQVASRTCTQIGRKIKEIYMYETLSETHWNIDAVEGAFVPNVFNDVTGFLDKKLEAVRAYKSQLKYYPDVRCVEALQALSIFRGSVMGMREAEAFVLVRMIS